MGKPIIKWTAQSENDLDRLREYIAENFNVDLAIKTVDELVIAIEQMLSDNPLCGQLLESSPLFSKLIYKGNVIYYCENPKDKAIYVVYLHSRKTDLNKDRISPTLWNT
ncbi:MAG: hypothetical protein COA86_17030 [Kangiella sp.]|nr:MAG: hypothetical protein COA86_17030 [Kangiella sp.]